MASSDVPPNITFKGWPPEPVKQGASCGVHTLVAKPVMRFTDDFKSLGWGNKELVLAVIVASPELLTVQDEAFHFSKEFVPAVTEESVGLLVGLQVVLNLQHLCFCIERLVTGREVDRLV